MFSCEKQGYQDGFNKGKEKGWNEGKQTGWTQGKLIGNEVLVSKLPYNS
jgi:flagellar biosynthesis/type III secretory pathway protein FliH